MPDSAAAAAGVPLGCPACGGRSGIEVLYSLSGIPVHSTVILDSSEDAMSFPSGDLDLCWCSRCGFAFNSRFDPRLMDYGAGYEESQGASPTFLRFANQLASDWLERHDLAGGHLVEIGCGKGDFLRLMCGKGRCTGTGYDPAYAPGRVAEPEGVTFVADNFTAADLPVEADFIICRHTLEHIPDTAGFLRLVRQACDGESRIAVGFELPDFGRILAELAFWDIYYEHCSYFTAGSLARAFAMAGFDVLDLRLVYGGQYLVLEAVPSAGQGAAPLELAHRDDTAAAVARFRVEGGRRIAEWRRRFSAWKTEGRRVALWGSGSKAVGFLTTVGEMAPVPCVVDINPARHGRYMPGCPMPIVAPAHLAEFRPDAVIAMNPLYRDEIAAELGERGIPTQLFTVDVPPALYPPENAR